MVAKLFVEPFLEVKIPKKRAHLVVMLLIFIGFGKGKNTSSKKKKMFFWICV
jgi:hypothetical protein